MKKIQHILRFALVPGVLLLSSCSALFYAPTSQSGHMFEKKGDVVASATLQSTPYTLSVAGDLAYAIDKRFFVNANYQYFEWNPENKGEFMELGVGYYRKLGKYGFLESSLLYGRARGLLELKPGQIMYFSLHNPSVSGVIGAKSKYFFASFGVKGGLLYKNQTSYYNIANTPYDYYNPWFVNDHGVYALEYMRYAAYLQLAGTIGVKYKAVSLSYFNTLLAGPQAYGTSYIFQADQFAGGLRLQLNLNIFR